MKKDSEIIQEIIKYMEDLKSAWEEIEKKEKSNVVSAPFQSSNRGSGLSIQG
ncbi:Flagellar protein FliS [Leptospira interrogans]|nr:Flagellar protein FliS [Leptospira interrogans]OCC29604.1 Flagellar protein FliS [Leptospira interrogans serovar Canicola]